MAEAFFPSILGNKASAQSLVFIGSALQNNQNNTTGSQNMPILEANGSYINVLDKDKSTDNTVDLSLSVNQNALVANTVSAVSSIEGAKGGDFSESTSVYVVRKGDTLSQIAEMFEVTQNTILWANDMKKGDTIKEGDVLLILPISGLEHEVKKGETLKGLATKYKIEVNDILWANNLDEDVKLAIGDKLIIPNATKEVENSKPIVNVKESIAKDNKYYEKNPTKTLSGYFINPVPSARKSQGIHGKNSVDLAAPTGTSVRASASGTVLLARGGYNGGYGNLVIIKHPNGTQTLYAHLSKISTTSGTKVSQGDVIGLVGSTGRSTGPHLHFEVHGARNPGADGSWAR